MYSVEIVFPLFVIAMIANVTLAIIVWRFAPHTISRPLFVIFVSAQILWAATNYFFFSVRMPISGVALFVARLTMGFAVLHAYFFFLFTHSFLAKKRVLTLKLLVPLSIVCLGIVILTFSPHVFARLSVSRAGSIFPEQGWALPIFGIFVGSCIIAAFFSIARKYRMSLGVEKQQWRFLTTGLVLTFLLILALSFLNFVVRGDISMVQYGHLYTLPFVIFTAYAMIRHHLLDIKAILAELSVILLSIILFMQVINSQTFGQFFLSLFVFVSSIVVGVLLIRGVVREIRQRQEMERLTKELQTANARLRELDRMKSEFLSFATHQLRSPLTAIKGYASLLLEGSFGRTTKKVHDAVDKIFQSAQALVMVVEDFLNISRIEQGRMKYNFANFDVKRVVTQVIEEQRPNIENAGLRATFSDDGRADYTIRADEGKIKQVVTNIVDNAIKYTPEGTIAVRLSYDSHERKVRVSVTDTGMGIHPDVMPRLFERFSRAKEANRHNITGTGLGLYLAREIMKAHRGHIFAESDGVGKGSTFHLEFYTNIVIGS